MTTPFFFGYGSLVNRRTHVYTDAHPAVLTGWRRCWRHIAALETAFLTAIPSERDHIEGLIAAVPGADWAALDEREVFYQRIDTGGVTHSLTPAPDIQHYHAPLELNPAAPDLRPILLSYLDVVVQGYLAEHGTTGVAKFFDTTDGWDAPVLDDRHAPRYPRHQVLSMTETLLVDAHLAKVNAQIIRP
ncbi:gamma-glutamylcyclotransferase [Rhodobacteraceae bacterium]|nr:gamma-glutamylcyclotransferase [Paracoccaceae bacterium]